LRFKSANRPGRAAFGQQGALIYLIALAICIAGIGRLIPVAKAGIPGAHALWIGYAASELVLPAITAAHRASRPPLL
jgi:hypothetical protein